MTDLRHDVAHWIMSLAMSVMPPSRIKAEYLAFFKHYNTRVTNTVASPSENNYSEAIDSQFLDNLRIDYRFIAGVDNKCTLDR